jgi:polyhydroxyalkanoate synthesis regulator phasin
MEATVHSIRSELDEKIQRRIENVVECIDHKTQEITKRIGKTLVKHGNFNWR